MPDTKSSIKHLSNVATMHQNILTSLQRVYSKQFREVMKVWYEYSLPLRPLPLPVPLSLLCYIPILPPCFSFSHSILSPFIYPSLSPFPSPLLPSPSLPPSRSLLSLSPLIPFLLRLPPVSLSQRQRLWRSQSSAHSPTLSLSCTLRCTPTESTISEMTWLNWSQKKRNSVNRETLGTWSMEQLKVSHRATSGGWVREGRLIGGWCL